MQASSSHTAEKNHTISLNLPSTSIPHRSVPVPIISTPPAQTNDPQSRTIPRNSASSSTSTMSAPDRSVDSPLSSQIHLPNEILSLIVSHTDQPTLVTLMSVSKITYTLAAPRLYGHIVITKFNAERLFVGLPRSTRYRKIPITSSFGDSMLEDGSDRFVKLIWPDVPLDSEDEEDENLEEESQSLKYAYPTDQSEAPKLNLFKHTHSITLTSLIPPEVCQDLHGWCKGNIRKTQRTLFPQARRLIIASSCVGDWADWVDRHDLDHHRDCNGVFFKLIAILGGFEHICITLPQYDESAYAKYLRQRPSNDITPSLRPRFFAVFRSRFHRMVDHTIPHFPVNLALGFFGQNPSMTLHNVTNGRPYAYLQLPNKLFFAPVSPAPGLNLPSTVYQATSKEIRQQQLLQIAGAIPKEADRRPRTDMVIVVPDAERDHLDWKGPFNKINQSQVGHRVIIKTMSQTWPCPCCSTKEGIH